MDTEKKTFEYISRNNFIVDSIPSYHPVWYKSRMMRRLLYYMTAWFYHLILFVASVFCKKVIVKKHKLAVCAIFKNEGRFLKEWIDYHITVGVNHFYLYNNNSDDNYYEILAPYIDKGIVDLIQWPQNHAQMECYRDCYDNHSSECEWIGFIDIDEFVCPISSYSIVNFLNKYSNLPSVAIYWKQFGSNGILEHDFSKLVIEQYTQCWPKMSTFTKMFLNTKFKHIIESQMHSIRSRIFGIKVPPLNQYGRIIQFGVNISKKHSDIQINHYWCKSWDEFQKKISQSCASQTTNDQLKRMRIERIIPHEQMSSDKDFCILRFLLQTKLAYEGKDIREQ